MKMNRLVTPISDIWTDEYNIVHKQVHENAHVDLNSIKKSFQQARNFTGPAKALLLYDVRAHFTITDEALDFLQGSIVESSGIATAILSNSIAVRIMADFSVKVRRLKVPLKVFSTEKDAISWLKAFKKEPIAA